MRNKIALVGFGYFGKIHYKYLKKYKVKKILTKNKKPNLKDRSIILTDNINEILEDKDLKYVDVVTPIETHPDLVIKFLKAGKKVLVEKPLLMKRNEERKIIPYVKKLVVSYPYLFSGSLNKANEYIKKKKLGKIKFIEISLKQFGRFSKFNVYQILGPHGISILSKYYNLKNIKFKIKNKVRTKGKIESGIIECYLNKKIISTISLSLNFALPKKEKSVNFYFEKGNIHCDLTKNKNNFLLIKFERKKINKKYFEKTKILKKIQLSFNEKNNIDKVIKNFINSQNNKKNNFTLTQKINNLIYYGKR